MPSARSSRLAAEEHHRRTVAKTLRDQGLSHLRVRRRAALLTLESGPEGERIPHARLRRVAVHQWQLEMATHTGRWQATPIRARLEQVIDMLVHDFGWTLLPIE
jgi:hypothetical protein